MKDQGKLIGPSTLYFERLLPGPIEKVWKYLTDSELRGLWFASGETELKPKGKIEFHFKHDRLSDEHDPIPEKYSEHAEGSSSYGEVLEVDPPFLLKYVWGSDGIVTYKLTEVESNQVLLELTHEKLSKDKDFRVGVMAGWHTHLNILQDRLEGKAPKGFWSVHMPLEDFYQKSLA